MHEKLNIRRKIRHRRNRAKGAADEEQGVETSSAGTVEEPLEEGQAPVARIEAEEEEEEQPQMNILATVVSLIPSPK